MSQASLENTLKQLDQVGTLVKDRGYRQIWRFEHDGKGYYVKFYPRPASRFDLKRMARGNPAMREFTRLQWLQKAGIPSPRAVAVLVGFAIGGTRGDAVIIEAIEPSVRLDEWLNDHLLRGERFPFHRELARHVTDIVFALGKAKLGHGDLHLGNFLLTGHETGRPRLHLLDAYAIRSGGLTMADLYLLGHSVRRYATRTDVFRAWELIGEGAPLPRDNPVTGPQWRKFVGRSTNENRYFGLIHADKGRGWSGAFFKHAPVPRRWAPSSAHDVTHRDWFEAWPDLLARIEADQLDVIKRSASGDVLSADISLGGRPVSVIVKRPRRKYWHRWVSEIGRGSRPRRAWRKAWKLVARDVPTAWPLLMMERRVMGYVVDAVVVFERVRGDLLAHLDLDALGTEDRDALFRRLGQSLRRMEETGLEQYDAKSPNWMIVSDEKVGPVPVVIDVDGIRADRGRAQAMHRLLRSMKEHPQYTPADSLALCQGYAPFAPMHREQPEGEFSEDAGDHRDDSDQPDDGGGGEVKAGERSP